MDNSKIQQKYFFKDGEEVCHIENTAQKMLVQKVVFKIYDRPSLADPNKKEPAKKITGIEVHWFDNIAKSFHTYIFHKRLLVPYDVALGATHADIETWLAENNS